MADAPGDERGVCANCGAQLLGGYCHLCGEKRLDTADRSLRHYLGGLVEALLNVDSKLWRSLRTLVRRPGLLSVEYWRGRRVPYMKPLSLFLVVNVVYFLLATWQGLSAVPFNYVIRTDSNVSLVERKLKVAPAERPDFTRAVAAHARAGSESTPGAPVARRLQDYGQRYNATAPLLSRSLVLVMIGLHTPFLIAAGLHRRRRLPLVAHLVFATHFVAFFLIAFLATEWFWRGVAAVQSLFVGARPQGPSDEDEEVLLVALPLVLVLGGYLYYGLRRFYEESKLLAVVKAVFLVIGMVIVFRAYQRVLFYATWLVT